MAVQTRPIGANEAACVLLSVVAVLLRAVRTFTAQDIHPYTVSESIEHRNLKRAYNGSETGDSDKKEDRANI